MNQPQEEGLQPPAKQRNQGSVLLFALGALSLLAAVAVAQIALLQANLRHAHASILHSTLHQYAESGIALAVHDFDNFLTGNLGNIGTEAWTPLDDLGADATPGTLDEGENDGIPTPGEPNLAPAPIGPASLDAGLLVSVYPTPYEGVFRIVSTCFTADESFTAERVYRNDFQDLSLPAPVYVNPEIQLALNSSSDDVFTIDANYSEASTWQSTRTLAGSSWSSSSLWGSSTDTLSAAAADTASVAEGPGNDVFALATSLGSTASENLFGLLAQVPQSENLELIGAGGVPSVGEVEGVEFFEIFDTFRGKATRVLSPGSYDDLKIGSWRESDDVEKLDTTLMGSEVRRGWSSWFGMDVIYVDGDLTLSGDVGEGLVVINGSLDFDGPAKFKGVLVVRGDVRINGDSGDVVLNGGVMIDGSLLQVGGGGSIKYDPGVLNFFSEEVRSYSPVYYREH